jgi:hypothetical protein
MKISTVLNANEPGADWKADAKTLMQKKKHFAVKNWTFSEYNKESADLAKEFDYDFAFDHKLTRAVFYPK